MKRKVFIIAKKAGFALLFFSGFLLILASVLNLRVLVDTHQVHCLPFSLAIVQYGQVGEIKRGDIVAFTPDDQMGPLFKEKIVVKQVSGLPGDVVSVRNGTFTINGEMVGAMGSAERAAKYLKRASPFLNKDVAVQPGELVMTGTHKRSFDSRYWGVLQKSKLMGRVYPIM